MVKKAMTFLDKMTYEPKMELIDTLLKVTEGKIFVEKQRARLTLKLAQIRESEGKIAEAAKIIQEVQVETFGAMKKKRKKRSTFSNKYVSAWRRKITFVHNSSARKYTPES